MSFSGMVKEELSRQISSGRHCRIAEIAALLMTGGRITVVGEKPVLRFQMENDSVVRKYFTLLQKTFNMLPVISVKESRYSKKGRIFYVDISDPEKTELILQSTKLGVRSEENKELYLTNTLVVQQPCCKRAFLRGCFLASGSISDPEKGYHLEIVCTDREKAKLLQTLIHHFEIDARIVVRKNSYVVYMKEGARIVDMLAVMEAGQSLMNLENIRIVKEVRNTVNRKVNCETANINKTVNAAVKQIEDIRLVEREIGFQSLDERLAELAELRLQFPEATLKELGMMLTPKVGKSGVNHRLRRLSVMAKELRGNKEELL